MHHEIFLRAEAKVACGASTVVIGIRGTGMIRRVSLVDLKLALRLLVKHRGLTLVGGLGIAVAVTIGAAFFGIVTGVFESTLPFESGERIVAIEVVDAEAGGPERRMLHDLAFWRDEVRSIEELGAWRPIRRNMSVPDGGVQPVDGAQMTASGFRLAGVAPVLGRTLTEGDEAASAAPVAVIGHDLWQARLEGHPDVVGREIRLGATVHTVVGVMPEGFGFPVSHGLWVPLRASGQEWGPLEGPEIRVFGRLAPGATLENAQTELTTIGQRMGAALPATHEGLRPRAMPYPLEFFGNPARFAFQAMQNLIILLLIVICVNVAVLVYARTASRVGEIAVRSALGASRGRIVTQLFAEALVLALAAGAIGLVAADMVLGWADGFARESGLFPFWIDLGVSPGAIVYVAGLALLAAAIIGIVPALKVTGRHLGAGLRDLGGAAELRLGRTWTALIVAQVAIAVAVLPSAGYNAWNHIRYGFDPPEFAADEFLAAQLGFDQETFGDGGPDEPDAELALRFGERLGELVRRLEMETAVAGVTFASFTIGDELPATVEVGGAPLSESDRGHRVRFNHVCVGYFGTFETPILAGRAFQSGDLAGAANAVVVNRTFVEQVLGGGNAVGLRIRYTDRHSRASGLPYGVGDGQAGWYEIVGIVGDDLVTGVEPGESEIRVYHPVSHGQAREAALAVRVRGGPPADFAPRLREIAAAVDPALHVARLQPLDEVLRQMHRLLRGIALAIGAVTLSVVLLSAAGIHAMMSFTVARRRREIGIRAARGGVHDARRPARHAGARPAGPARRAHGGAESGTVGAGDRRTSAGDRRETMGVVLTLVEG